MVALITVLANIAFAVLGQAIKYKVLNEEQTKAALQLMEVSQDKFKGAANALASYRAAQAGLDAQRAEYEKEHPTTPPRSSDR